MRLLKKFAANVQCNYMKYEIIRKRMVIEKMKLIYLNLHITTRSRICR